MPSPRPLLVVALLVPACADPPPEPVARRVDLRAAGLAAPHLAGVAIEPDGSRLVLDDAAGLYRVAPDGTAALVRALAALPTPDVPVRPPFTDVVALGDGRFALTAIGDGYLLDLGADTMRQYFCYEPGGFPEDEEQRTTAVTYDPVAARLYAQPRTFDAAGALLRSEVAAYAADTGADVAWRSLPDELDAGGMVADADGLLLGAGSRLYRYDLTTYTLTATDDLARFGVGRIAGLGLDAAAQRLVVVDAARAELTELDLATLAR
jgi:hypothetical protein